MEITSKKTGIGYFYTCRINKKNISVGCTCNNRVEAMVVCLQDYFIALYG